MNIQNKKAWEYRAYEFWNKKYGSPIERAKQIVANPRASLKKHQEYFDYIEGLKIANICGSNGRKAVPLSLLGADVTLFDISEENKRYALELAHHANTSIDYIVGDIYDLDINRFADYFDILYLEGGILHYFHDIDKFMTILFTILKEGGKMILSDFHPLRRCIGPNNQYEDNYFDQEVQSGDVAYKQFFDERDQQDFPDVLVKPYTLSEIINSVISSGFTLQKFDEHRGWNHENMPWEFTIQAVK
ncbi:class I SAM-dependent methyltransferase [Bacillus carboniphilus]|uniref:Class I SAM-dependent methyltransferase n=1 Tax=Bacillus carboniphilus TaxID=86663 RepID=A0ABN0VZC7_9BACI